MPKRSRKEYNEYMREYMLKRYHKRRKEALASLGGRCSRCGSTKSLEIDHTNNSKDKIVIARLWSISKERYLEELKQCQLLCKECHTNKSVKEKGQHRACHGHVTMAINYKCKCSPCTIALKKYRREYSARRRKEKRGDVA